MNLWPVEQFCPPFFSRSALIWKKPGDKSVQLVRGLFLSKYFLQNPYFKQYLHYIFIWKQIYRAILLQNLQGRIC